MAGSLRVFLCYRRADTRYVAGRVADRLTERFGQVFMDIDTIDPGVDFTDVIRQALSECDVLPAFSDVILSKHRMGVSQDQAVGAAGKAVPDEPALHRHQRASIHSRPGPSLAARARCRVRVLGRRQPPPYTTAVRWRASCVTVAGGSPVMVGVR
jgi:hypothetical protein